MNDFLLVEKQKIVMLINNISKLNVNCEKFEDANKWVGIVMFLEDILNSDQPVMKDVKEDG